MRPFPTFAAAIAFVAMPVAASAQGSDTGQLPQRIRSVTIQRGQECPKATSSDEVVVCSTIIEPYRIPGPLRGTDEPTAANQSWVNRAATVDQVGRVAGGLPNTCSAVGTGGQSGCFLARNQAFAAEKRAAAREAESVPGGGE